MQLTDRPFQELASEAFLTSEFQRALVVLPTGCGKTITAQKTAKRLGARTLWLAHRDELITQPANSIKIVWPEISTGIVKAELNQYMRHMVFASIQSAQQPKRIAQLADQRFGLVVVDEAHHALSPGYIRLLEQLGCFTPGGPRLLGLTATPERSDQGALSDVFQGIVFQLGITTAIEQGYLVPPTVIERSINVDLDAITTTRGDYGQKQLDLALLKSGIVEAIAGAFEAECLDRKTIVFVVSVEQAEAVAAHLRGRGHAVAAVSGETPTDDRKRILKKLHTGELKCVVNCMVLTEGFDEPSVDAVILARPTQSKPLMIQCVGRGLRLYPGKSDCKVIDMVGASKRNTMVQAAVLFGIRPDPKERPKSIALDPLTDPEEFWKARLMSQIEGVGGAPRSKLRWVAGEGGVWLLDAGAFGTVRMLPAGLSATRAEGDYWTVDVVGIRIGDEKRLTLSADPVTLDIAQAYAEDYVRRKDAVNKALADAQWRGAPAAKGQIEFLRKAGVKVTTGITKGTAADLELQVKAKHAVDPATPGQKAFLKRMRVPVPENLTKREAQGLIIKAKHRKTNAQ